MFSFLASLPFSSLLFLALCGMALGSALGALLWAIVAFFSRPGERRSKRFGRTLASALLALAACLSAWAVYHLLLVPGTMKAVKPEFRPPYEVGSHSLLAAVLVLLFASAIVVIRARKQGGTTGKRAWQLALGCLLLAAVAGIADYQLIHRVQVPAFDRYVFVDSREWKTHVGGPAPEISVAMLDGSQRQLAELRGKIVLLNFFATWCGPCGKELPHLQELWSQHGQSDGFAMLVVSRGETRETVSKFVAERGFTFPVALDAEALAFGRFAESGIPRTYLIGRDGQILFQTIGFSDGTPFHQREWASLRRLIDEALAAQN